MIRPLPDTPRAGLAIAVTAFLVAPGMDVFAKLLTQTISPGMVGFGRFLMQTVLLLPLVWAMSQWERPNARHVLAGVFLGAALLCFNAALQVMPIANAIAIFFVEPLLVTVLSAVLLGEKIGWRRIVAVCVSLIGAMIVIRPNWAEFGPTAALPLGTALFFSLYIIVTKTLAAGPNKLALQFWTGLAATIAFAGATAWGTSADIGPLVLTWPTEAELWLFLGMGILAVVSHQMIVLALARLDASVVIPMQYLEIISATLFGWWIFNDLPDRLTWLGAGIIILSGLYVVYRERQQENAA